MKKLCMYKFYLFLFILLFAGCQSVKDGLTGKKKSNSDEFLIEKKNPLVLPPGFEKLPKPRILSEKEKKLEEEIDLETILTKKAITTKPDSVDSKSSKSLEKSILEKIKNN
jgi:hypothetical protein|tara:strand:- start:123 stop:455 length:333 start_codon:yes stop_codon:yes gene_type:complete